MDWIWKSVWLQMGRGAATRRGTHALQRWMWMWCRCVCFDLWPGNGAYQGGSRRSAELEGCYEYFVSLSELELGSVLFRFVSFRFRSGIPDPQIPAIEAPPAALMKIIYYAMPFN